MIKNLSLTLAQSTTVTSAYLNVTNGNLFALWAPVLNTCSIFVLGSPDTTSANFVRLGKSDGTGNWGWATPGSQAVTLQDIAFPFPYLKLEASVGQAADRVFQIIVKIR